MQPRDRRVGTEDDAVVREMVEGVFQHAHVVDHRRVQPRVRAFRQFVQHADDILHVVRAADMREDERGVRRLAAEFGHLRLVQRIRKTLLARDVDGRDHLAAVQHLQLFVREHFADFHVAFLLAVRRPRQARIRLHADQFIVNQPPFKRFRRIQRRHDRHRIDLLVVVVRDVLFAVRRGIDGAEAVERHIDARQQLLVHFDAEFAAMLAAEFLVARLLPQAEAFGETVFVEHMHMRVKELFRQTRRQFLRKHLAVHVRNEWILHCFLSFVIVNC